MSRTAKGLSTSRQSRSTTPKEIVLEEVEVPVQVPLLTAYPSTKGEGALVDASVMVGESIQPARPIPDSFPSNKVYLKVRIGYT